ncbi:MAG: pur operon repressor [Phascolarctobacterium sp.]|nr:pur operon repressor [Candidatus Phascolarctobacterium caballi]
MNRIKRIERIIAMTKILIDNPHYLFSFRYFCEKFQIAKSTLSEDVSAIKNSMDTFGIGKVETLAGAAGGVRFVPGSNDEEDQKFLVELAHKLSTPDRILPGGLLYMTDLLCDPQIVSRLGEIFMKKMYDLRPDCIMTVETRGIPLALLVARAFNVPLVMARHGSSVTEGSSVNINYVSGTTKTIQTMTMPKRSLHAGERVLIIDDLMKGGGTAHGMVKLVEELGAVVVGKAFLIEAAEPQDKIIADYTALLRLYKIDEANMKIDIKPN